MDLIPQWKVLVTDETSKKLIDNVVKEDNILHENVTSEVTSKMHRELGFT